MFAAFSSIVSQALAQQVLSMSAPTAGWYDSTGFHDAFNSNYLVQDSTGTDYHNFAVLNIFSGPRQITSATIDYFNPNAGYSSSYGSLTFTLFDVSTSTSALTGGGSGLTSIFNDLGSGTSFGAVTVTSSSNNTTVHVPVNAAGLAALNAARGGTVSFGGAVTSGANAFLFSNSGGSFFQGHFFSNVGVTVTLDPTTNWNNSAGGSWFGSSNWNPTAVPTSVDDAIFSLASTYAVSFTSNATAKTLNIADGNVEFDLGGNTLAIQNNMLVGGTGGANSLAVIGTAGALITTTQLDVGNGAQSGDFLLNGATLNLTSATATNSVGGSGVSGHLHLVSGATLNSSGTLNVANSGVNTTTGTLEVRSNSHLTAPTLNIAGSSGTAKGSVIVDNGGMNIPGNLALSGTFGGQGSGFSTLTIQNGGSVTVGGTAKVWNNGMIFLSGGTLSVGSLDTGGVTSRFYDNWTAGTLSLTASELDVGNGQTLGNSISMTAGKGVIASANVIIGRGSTGTLSVTGGAVQSTLSNGGLVIGYAGSIGIGTLSAGTVSSAFDFDIGLSASGTFTQTGGLTSITHSFNVGNSGGTGTAALSGGSLSAANIFVGPGGSTGTLAISGRGSVTASSTTTVLSHGTLIVSGGTLMTRDLDLSSAGSFSLTGGTIIVNGGALTGKPSTQFEIQGNLTLQNTATASTYTTKVGYTSQQGTLLVNCGSSFATGFIDVGFHGLNGRMIIDGTGSSVSVGGIGVSAIGGNGSNGWETIQNSAVASYSSPLWIALTGNNGSGTLEILSGAMLNSTSSITIGQTSAQTNLRGGITVDDATLNGVDLAVSGTAIAAGSGLGTVTIQNNAAASLLGTLKIWPGGVTNLQSGATLKVGTLDLSGNPSRLSWTGGALRINSLAPAADGLLTVPNTGTLGGVGNIQRPVTVSAGGTLAPGNSVGTISTGALTLQTDATNVIDVDFLANTADKTQVTGTVNLSGVDNGAGGTTGGANLQFTFLSVPSTGLPTPRTFTIIDNDSGDAVAGLFKNILENVTYQRFGITYSVDYHAGTGNDVAVTFYAVPEPAGLGFFMMGGVMARRRRWITNRKSKIQSRISNA